MTRQELIGQIRRKSSFLCVGIDPDPMKLPPHLGSGPGAIIRFCSEIIRATSDFCVAYKLNIAFFEALGKQAWDVLYATREQLPADCLLIADAKRADIGNSSRFYARAFFDDLNFDAVTVSPYMGEDSVRPFLEFTDKWTILLALTSNTGSQDFQMTSSVSGIPLYEQVIARATSWGGPENLMFVAGATHPGQLKHIREIVPDHFLLIPGVGTQGGNLSEVADACLTQDIGILVNSSREIIYASAGEDYSEKAGEHAHRHRNSMRELLDQRIHS